VNVTIYGLRDPRDRRVRYVGRTRRPLAVRLTGHFSECRTRPDSPKSRWLADLRSNGLAPEIFPIEECLPESAAVVEAEAIRRFVETDPGMLNNVSRRGMLTETISIRCTPAELATLKKSARRAELALQREHPHVKLTVEEWMLGIALSVADPTGHLQEGGSES
jgi:hypothetical protein